jgi:hypothetical protein
VLGTLEYMAPEHGADAHGVDIRADVYSLGCTLYDLLAGRPPFSGPGYASIPRLLKAHAEAPVPPIRQYRPDVPDGLVAVLERMLAKDPAGRYATPAEVAEALRPFAAPSPPAQAASLPAPAEARTAPAASPGRGRRWKRPVLAPACAVLAVLLLGAMWWRFGPGAAAPQVNEFHIKYARMVGAKPVGGDIDLGLADVRSGDALHFRARLSRPAHCYLVVINPSGVVQLAYPEPTAAQPGAIEQLDWPDKGWGIDPEDGTGLMAVVLVASRRPLPPFPQWRPGAARWEAVAGDGVWRFDGQTFERCDQQRGQVRGAAPRPLHEACYQLKTSPGVDAVKAWAFPVKPKE